MSEDIITFLVMLIPVIAMPVFALGLRKALPALFGGVIGIVWVADLSKTNGIDIRTIFNSGTSAYVPQTVSVYPLILLPAFFTLFCWLAVILLRRRIW